MGNNSSHRRTKVSKQVGQERPPDTDKALGKQQLFSHFRQKPGTKILLLFSADERRRQQQAEAAAGPVARPGRRSEDSVGSLAAAPGMRGAGDGAEWQEGARARARDEAPGPGRAAGGGGAPRSGRNRGRGPGLAELAVALHAPGDPQRLRPCPGAAVQATPSTGPGTRAPRPPAPTQ